MTTLTPDREMFIPSSLLGPPPTNEIAAAVAAAQAEMRNPTFDRVNASFVRGNTTPKANYASLAAVRDAVVPVLGKHGVAVLQDCVVREGAVECTTRLLHKSGQSLTFGPLRVPVGQATPQAIGSATTYARRFQLMTVGGVAGDEDDDGEAAEPAQKPAAPEIPTDSKVSLEDAAKESADALKAAWGALSKETRALITQHHAGWWNDTKAKAAKVAA